MAISSVSVMKSYLMIIAILFILAQKTPGDLFSAFYNRNPERWNPCELNQGRCKTNCNKREIQYLHCLNNKKCCLSLYMKVKT
nr:beta-defensin 116 [Cavia porcellus]